MHLSDPLHLVALSALPVPDGSAAVCAALALTAMQTARRQKFRPRLLEEDMARMLIAVNIATADGIGELA